MKEDFLHFIWKYKLYESIVPIDSSIKIEVKDPGIHNRDAGPDFFNSKIRIGETTWAGNVEIHLNSSDWNRHGHQKDPSYNNVILHLVDNYDQVVFHANGNKVFNAKINFNPDYYNTYQSLIQSEMQIACSKDIPSIDTLTLQSWITDMLIERIEAKTDELKMILRYTNNHIEEAFYISLAKSFGFKVNTEPFELLAKSLPSIVLAKNKSNVLKIEALLFGQAGFLNEHISDDPYYNELRNEYHFLRVKYKLKPIEQHLWKFLRIRPANFPTIRIAQFASLVYKSSHLFSKVEEAKQLNELFDLFEPELNAYWKTHYVFGKETGERIKSFGKPAVESIIINTVLPVLFLYGKEKCNSTFMDRALNFYEEINSEVNRVTKKWTSIGVEPKNAFESQAFIQLYNTRCSKKKCIDCHIGARLLINQAITVKQPGNL